MFTFYYTYPKQLDNTTGTMPRETRKQRLAQDRKNKDTQLNIEQMKDMYLLSSYGFLIDRNIKCKRSFLSCLCPQS